MGLSSLNTALSGLRAAQEQMNTLSTNISNADTAGYTRKVLPQQSITVDGVSIGVATGIISRQVDLNLSKDLWAQKSSLAELDVRQTYLGRIEAFHGAPEDESSIAARVSKLKDSFSELSNSPESSLLQSSTLATAQSVAGTFRDLSELITTLRNDAQSEIDGLVTRANSLIQQIADSNDSIQNARGVGRTSAELEDNRDRALTELSKIMEVTFFQRGDGVLVVKAAGGTELASDVARQLTFSPSPLSTDNAYPNSAAGLYVGDPISDPSGSVDITTFGIGGKIGGLIELRDVDLQQQAAQVDELAHKLATRLSAQGLDLFTDSNGNIPPDGTPNPSSNPPVPVPYVGFASSIEVNSLIIEDPSILQSGTSAGDIPIASGSDRVIRRVVNFAFGELDHQQINGSVDIRATANGAADLQEWLGVSSKNRITGTRDIASLGDLVSAAGSPFSPAGSDTFTITIDPNGEGSGPTAYNVDINAVLPTGAATAADLATHITALDPDISSFVDSSGRLVIESTSDINFSDVNMGANGFSFLGLVQGTHDATDPYIDIRVGSDDTVRITIPKGTSESDFIDSLMFDPSVSGDTGVPDLTYDQTTYAATGQLILRPGDDFDNPSFGGDLRIISGDFTTDGTGGIGAPAGVNLVSALFGTFSSGTPPQNLSPITDVENPAFRNQNLGPIANVKTGVSGASDVVDFGQKFINVQAITIVSIEAQYSDSSSLHDLIESQWLNTSGVNVDEELAHMIQVQTAFSASAKIVGTVQEMFDALLSVV